MQHSEIQIPSSVLDFYVKLYCRKRRKTKSKVSNVISEATKSWLTLSNCEKQHFTKKYDQIKKNIKNQFANQLKNAVPYLKRKVVPVPRPLVQSHTEEHVIEEDNITILSEIDQTLVGVSEEITEETSLREQNNTNNVIDKPIQEQSSENLYENYNIPLSEPIPPKFLSGEELFNMVNETQSNQSWTALTTIEKRKYQNAVLTIKRNYLKEYQKYLENLPSEKLYNYYKNNVSAE